LFRIFKQLRSVQPPWPLRLCCQCRYCSNSVGKYCDTQQPPSARSWIFTST